MASQSITRARPGGVKGDPASRCLVFFYYFESVLFPEILCTRYVPSINKPMFAAVSEVSSEQLFWKRRAMLNKRKEHTPFLLSRVITLHLYLGFPGLEPGWSVFFS